MKTVLLYVIIIALLTGCFAAQAPTVAKQTFTFDYTPRQSASAGSAGMVLALVKPYYASSFTAGSGDLFQSFQRSIGSDIEELIIAKGFTMKGPFAGFDEMVFEDKKRTDLLIQIEINPEFTATEGGWRSHVNILTPGYAYSYEGNVSLVGKINVSGVEPLTNEKIWSKSVSIPNVENIQIKTSQKYDRPLSAYEILRDPGVYNALGKALQQQYGGILEKVAAHFNVDEFNTLKNQIKELKSKKGF